VAVQVHGASNEKDGDPPHVAEVKVGQVHALAAVVPVEVAVLPAPMGDELGQGHHGANTLHP
jgi:hypothetical protein